ncbi:pyridoxal phosphate-dependent aminotransferase [Bailinhaonella thermotolerans]|uniref:Pyridoxal phosphate-dependent aminotransferase n=1 Tax=Bailinhaonella thermotolerans TaxID=1070861 RepID=A0A3A4AQM3_9ACTN|nr:pyridoxal phosphate-dependent aminotransferase [Bailinhaonella thermotolerans]RJL32036.1 pyridoxal phosphate-dependent aminotransferase [Bailinhaonella thermotolerans]
MSVSVSATLAANEALENRRRAGLPVLPLAFGEAGLPVHPALSERLAAAATGRNAYGPVAGTPELREAAAGYWVRRGSPTPPDQVVAGPGSKPLLFALLLAIGGDVAVPKPSWVSYAAQAGLTKARPIFVPTREGRGGVPDADALARAVRLARAGGREVRSVVVTLPDNPTGTLATPRDVRDLCSVARELDLTIIADEIYRDLVHDPDAEFLSPAALLPERTVVTTALSKSLALGGWRIGVARLPDGEYGRRLRDELLGVASEIWSSPAGPIQDAAAYAFSEPDELTAHIALSRRLHGRVAHAVADRFAAAGARVVRPQGGFYLYPDFEPLRGALGVSGNRELAARLLDEHGVGVLPGAEFGDDEHALRLRVATSLLYGDSVERREAALAADEPLALPWIADSLARLEEALAKVTRPALVAL